MGERAGESSGGEIRIWYTTAFDPRSRKWLSVEHMEQVVGVFESQAEAMRDGKRPPGSWDPGQ